MINDTLINDKPYKSVCFWRNSKKNKSVDDKGNIFPYPKIGHEWSGKIPFLEQLKLIQKYCHKNDKFEKNSNGDVKDCLICKKEEIDTGKYFLGKYIWTDGLYHYVKHHNIKPPDEFIDRIWNTEIITANEKITGKIKVKHNKKYLKLGRNQLMILDALMRHGGYTKKYYDTKNNGIIRYSEHAGFIDIKGKYLENIIVSGNTIRVDSGDEDIFLPTNSPDTYNYKYIFHTHPPTPKPGGRAKEGILYEFPSIGDILHFIDHHNDGDTIGSLVMTSEGLYNIRKTIIDKEKIEIDEDDMYNEIRKIQKKVQELALKEYGDKFTTYYFYSKISQDRKYIDMINEKLNKYNLIIDYFPRTKDFKGTWVVDTVYVPIL